MKLVDINFQACFLARFPDIAIDVRYVDFLNRLIIHGATELIVA